MLKWIGFLKGAQGLVGIPARDLNADEVAQYGGAKALLATGLYETTAKPAKAQPAAVEKDDDNGRD